MKGTTDGVACEICQLSYRHAVDPDLYSDSPIALLQWCFGGQGGEAPIHSCVVPASAPECHAILHGLRAAVLSEPDEDAFVELSRVVGGELRVILGSYGDEARRALFHDALYALKLLALPEPHPLQLTDLADVAIAFPTLSTWMNVQALPLREGTGRHHVVQAVARCTTWLASGSKEEHAWELLRVAAHARILQHNSGETAGTEPLRIGAPSPSREGRAHL